MYMYMCCLVVTLYSHRLVSLQTAVTKTDLYLRRASLPGGFIQDFLVGGGGARGKMICTETCSSQKFSKCTCSEIASVGFWGSTNAGI